MAHKGLPDKKIRCVRTTMMARSTSSHVRPDRLARTKMTIPFEFPCNARPVHRSGASAADEHNRVQRFWRDANAAALHPSIDWDTLSALYGTQQLGLQPQGIF